MIKIYTGDLLDGITFTSPTLVSRPAETTFQRGGVAVIINVAAEVATLEVVVVSVEDREVL